MKLTNNIGWCDDTGNMVVGCTPVSDECLLCYAKYDTPARVLRAGGWPGMEGRKVETWGALGERVPVASLEQKARRYNKLLICDRCRETQPNAECGMRSAECKACGAKGSLRRIRLFADSNSDFLDRKWPVERLVDLFRLMHECPNVDFILFTKRIEDFRERMCAALLACTQHAALWEFCSRWRRGAQVPANVWLGVSVGVRSSLPRIRLLRDTPAAVRVVSFEPLLEDVFPIQNEGIENAKLTDLSGIDWAIFGGESGPVNSPDPKRRPRECDVNWIEHGVREALAADVRVYVKQMGSKPVIGDVSDPHGWPEADGPVNWETGEIRLKHPDGADPAEWPEHFRRREWPGQSRQSEIGNRKSEIHQP